MSDVRRILGYVLNVTRDQPLEARCLLKLTRRDLRVVFQLPRWFFAIGMVPDEDEGKHLTAEPRLGLRKFGRCVKNKTKENREVKFKSYEQGLKDPDISKQRNLLHPQICRVSPLRYARGRPQARSGTALAMFLVYNRDTRCLLGLPKFPLSILRFTLRPTGADAMIHWSNRLAQS